MKSCAVSFTAGTGTRRFELAMGQQVVIGRSQQSDLCVNSARLSRTHCAVKRGERGLILQDLGSSNGTFVNGQRVQEALLRPGDLIQLGGIAIRTDFDPAVAKVLELRCERCERQVSMARVEDGHVLELGKRFLCTDCAAVLHHQNLSQTEQQMIGLLREEGFEVEGKTPLSTGLIPVFRARRVGLDTIVAVKCLPLLSGVSKKKVARFQAEAKAAAKVRHPNVVEIYDIRQAPGALYIVMEHVEGELLLEHVERRGPLDERAALRLGLLVTRALATAHRQGIVHRDLKPAGIMLDLEGAPKVTDFGLAKDLWAITGDITGPEETLGTVRYMPPEQLKNAREADHRADLYSLGATLYHVLTGAPPYSDRSELDLMSQVLAGTLPRFDPSKAALSAPLIRVLSKAMAYERDQRYESAEELEQGLGACVTELLEVSGYRGDPLLLLSMGKPSDSTWRGPRAAPGGVAGVFAEDELIEFLQMIEFNKKSGVLEVQGERTSGHLAFQEGRLRAAVTADGRRGHPAVVALVGARGGRFDFVPKLPERFRADLDLGVSSVLMEALRQRDEASR